MARDRVDDLLKNNGEEKKPSNRSLNFQPASDIKPRRTKWAWDTAAPDAAPQEREGRAPVGSLVIAVGRAGVGKSQHACWMTARVTTGTLPGEWYGRPRSVVYSASEDSWQMTIVPRLIAAGADLKRVFRINVTDDEDVHARLTLPSDTLMLENGIREHDIAMVVMDPLLSLIDSSINDYRAREVRDALEPLVAMADRTGVLLWGLAHFTKASGSDPLMLVSGSAAFGQLVRAAVAFARDDAEEDQDEGDTRLTLAPQKFVMSTIKNNLGRENLPSLAYEIEPYAVDTDEGEAWVSRLAFTGEVAERSVRDILRGGLGVSVDPEDRTERQSASRWLKDYLGAHEKAPSKDVKKAAHAAGFADRTLQRARVQLRVIVKDEGFPRTSYWSLPVDCPVVPPKSESKTGGTTEESLADQLKCQDCDPQATQWCHVHAYGTTGTTVTNGVVNGPQRSVTESDTTCPSAVAEPQAAETALRRRCQCGNAVFRDAATVCGKCDPTPLTGTNGSSAHPRQAVSPDGGFMSEEESSALLESLIGKRF